MRPPLVLVPGIQGHWAYMRPTVEALSRDFTVLTFSLGAAKTLDDYVDQIVRTLDQHGVDRAVVCGVSFGGLVALRFAALHPERTSALVLTSTPAPRLGLRRRHQLYTRLPWILGPFFLVETPLRLGQEIATAIPDWRARWAFRFRVLRILPGALPSLSQMAARARMISATDLTPDCERVTAPTLVVTGEQQLDHVVPVDGTSAYARLIPNACATIIERTGHIGSITRPDAFADVIRDFVDGHRHAAA
jgi:3-oxoadipate enol-lactonase